MKWWWRIWGDDGARAIGATADAGTGGAYRVINNDGSGNSAALHTAGGAWSRSRSWNDQQNWPELPLIAALTRTRRASGCCGLTCSSGLVGAAAADDVAGFFLVKQGVRIWGDYGSSGDHDRIVTLAPGELLEYQQRSEILQHETAGGAGLPRWNDQQNWPELPQCRSHAHAQERFVLRSDRVRAAWFAAAADDVAGFLVVVADLGRRWSSRRSARPCRCRHRGSYRVINNDRKFCSTDTAGGAWSRSRSWNDQQNWPELPLIAALTRTREHRVLRPDLLERPGRCSGG